MSSIVISGDTSGSVTLQAPAIAGSTVVTLPTTSMNIGTGGGSIATNTAFGASALNANTTGANNVAVGYLASDGNTTGIQNVAIGSLALRANTTAGQSVAVGYQAARLQTGGANVAVGFNSLLGSAGVSTGTSNTAIGTQALLANTTASNNTAVGYQAGYSNTTGAGNTFIGDKAGYTSNGTGNVYNTCVGQSAGYGLTTGVSNTFIGVSATASASGALITTGSRNSILGPYSGNQGGLDIRTADNYVVLSDGDGNPRCWWNNYGAFTNVISGSSALSYGTSPVSQFVNSTVSSYTLVVANANASPASQYVQDIQFSGSTPNNTNARFLACTDTTNEKAAILSTGGFLSRNNSYGTYSDIKLKENVVDASPKLNDVMRLQVRNFNFKTNPETKQIGFIAQEFEQVFPAMVDESQDRGKDGAVLDETTKSIKTSVLIPILVKAIQEQQALITTLTTRITALEAKVGA